MCTLPSEGVSFCLSAAAKSLLNKKADVKVRQLLVPSLHLPPQSSNMFIYLQILLFSQDHQCYSPNISYVKGLGKFDLKAFVLMLLC